MKIPKWAERELTINSKQEFWQFSFRESETKTRRAYRALLPKDVAELLQQFVEIYRPLLIRGNSPTNLFLNDTGGAFKPQQFTSLVCRLTERFLGKSISPHRFRNILAVDYLRSNPADYLTVQRHLWHSNPLTTISIYGSGFNEADAARSMEEWRTSIDETHDEPTNHSRGER